VGEWRGGAGLVNLGSESLGAQLLAGKWIKKMMIIHNNLMKSILLVLACLIALASSVQAPRTLVPGPNCYIALPTDKCAECQFGFLIINETCVASPHRNCKTFNPYKGTCTSCYVGYAKQTDGSCAVDPTVNVF
jgi:hypothetical protein